MRVYTSPKEGQAARKGTAEAIAAALSSITRRMGGTADPAEVSKDFRQVAGSYRSEALPKEGAYSVGEYKYEEMVRSEIARASKAVDIALAPYKDKISGVDIHDGEKSWIYVSVKIK